VDADLDTLATALYVTIDDLLKAAPYLAPWRPAVGIAPKLGDAELVTLALLVPLDHPGRGRPRRPGSRRRGRPHPPPITFRADRPDLQRGPALLAALHTHPAAEFGHRCAGRSGDPDIRPALAPVTTIGKQADHEAHDHGWSTRLGR
jgi:hypothetical protein